MLLLLFLVFTVNASAEADITVEDIERELARKSAGVHTCRVKVSAEQHTSRGTTDVLQTSSGTMEMCFDGAGTKYRLETAGEAHIKPRDIRLPMRILIVADPQYAWYEVHQHENTTIGKQNTEDANLMMAGPRYISALRARFVVTAVNEQLLNGQPCWVIHGNARDDVHVTSSIARSVSYIRKKDGLPIQSDMFDRDGNLIMRHWMSDPEFNVTLDPLRFEYKPAIGQRIIDMTRKTSPSSAPSTEPATKKREE